MVSTKVQKPVPATYWHDDQFAVIHHSPLEISEPKEKIIASLNLKDLHSFTGDNGFSLAPFTWQDVPRPSSQRNNTTLESERHVSDLSKQNPLESPIGKYLFRDPSGGTLVVSFFHITRSPGKTKKAPHVVNLVNTKLHSGVVKGTQAAAQSEAQLTTRDAKSGMRLIAAMPHFWCASTNGPNYATNGCPISPPFPVPSEKNHITGKWHIDPSIPDSLKEATGKGVFVFVLDTLPPPEQIYQADEDCKERNTLLHDVAQNVTLNYRVLADSLDDPLGNAPMTGWDINGERVNFPMEDHGVFIAGIIRDLAPGSKVECIRVLNDYGVGNIAMLVDALSHIQNRLLPTNPETGKEGDLHEKRVVVNMSLTATPSEEALEELGYTDQSMAPARLALLQPMRALAEQGVVFAASAGNGSGPNNQYTEPTEQRVGPRFPAAFAYGLPGINSKERLATMIPVGAINEKGQAASYSNYPGDLGIGTYGGEIPQAGNAKPNSKTGTPIKQPVDAVRGVYTASYYPALAKTDPLPTLSPVPMLYPLYEPSFSSTWAYWSGTSFATPIISALAARVLETQKSVGDSVRKTLLTTTSDKVDWTNLFSGVSTGINTKKGKKIVVSQKWEEA
ncbi:MAG TPA: S8 family serine peptidase [Ktedonobacteraceae bacterium]|nr:S8 family serine peptidase [Ktedonobacteraceae bacterium]